MFNSSAGLREKIDAMDNDSWNRRNLIGSTIEWLAEDSTGVLKHSQVPTWSEVTALTYILEPIKKCGTAAPNDQTKAREDTPWHRTNVVLDILARQELTRQKVAQEAKRALALDLYWKEEKTKGIESAKEVLLLPKKYKDKLKYLASSNTSKMMREKYMFISIAIRRMHIYETLRTRSAGVDELIRTYFPQEIPKNADHLYLDIMKTATPDEMKSYSGERKLVYSLYKDIDAWEDQLQKEGINEEIMNGLAQTPGREFSYPVEFERKFPPFLDWTEVVSITLGWSRTVLNMVNTLEKMFDPSDTS
ncbi:hypothetical protein B0J17DRAFT_671185 [Rhizoctonia solani]|nr:hypothetical protein B0J17DRAFT_671185 [Rhizoctonia solani]